MENKKDQNVYKIVIKEKSAFSFDEIVSQMTDIVNSPQVQIYILFAELENKFCKKN